MSLVMGIDLGTSSAKTVLMDEAGHIVSMASADYPLFDTTPRLGRTEPRRLVARAVRDQPSSDQGTQGTPARLFTPRHKRGSRFRDK